MDLRARDQETKLEPYLKPQPAHRFIKGDYRWLMLLSTGIITTTADGHIDSTEWLSMGWTMSTF
jgi:uncharacterized membrane protein YebE (DUF533 family)